MGQSQVLPYLIGLGQEGYQFTILSFEKKERYLKYGDSIRELMTVNGIDWVPLNFSKNPPVLSKYYDVLRMRSAAFRLQKHKKFDMVHCRSYIASNVGLALKKKYGIKFLFDMRGFWADEKKDGGAWPQHKALYRRIYNYYKKREAEFIQQADHIISLTNAGKKEMLTWSTYEKVPITVIPCCADMNLFSVTDADQKQKSRSLLKIDNDRFVISYLGSIGAWYMLDEMLDLFVHIKKKFNRVLFLFITHSSRSLIAEAAAKRNIPVSDLLIIEATRAEVPLFAKSSDISISFIKPVYSKISSSPTKLGGLLAMGLPVISNDRVGDVEEVITRSQGGWIIREFTEQEYDEVVSRIPDILAKDPSVIRNNIQSVYSLEKGIELYKNVYNQLFSGN